MKHKTGGGSNILCIAKIATIALGALTTTARIVRHRITLHHMTLHPDDLLTAECMMSKAPLGAKISPISAMNSAAIAHLMATATVSTTMNA